jgi:cytochrome c oxidase subunit 4
MRRAYLLTWIALMGLLALTLASSYFPMGKWNTALNIGISCAKMLLIATFFMHLRQAGALVRITALVGLLWLSLLLGLSATDFATRLPSHATWSAPR